MSAKAVDEIRRLNAVREANYGTGEKLAEALADAATSGPTLRATDGMEEPPTPPPADESLFGGEGSINASRIEAPGTVFDVYSGKTWTLPTDSKLDNIGLLMHKSPYDIKKDPNYHYEFHSVKEIPEYLSQDFVCVTRAELGLSDLGTKQPGTSSPLDAYYVVDGNDICMKIPRQIAALRYDALKRMSDAAVAQTKAGRFQSARETKELLVKSDDVVQVKRELTQHADNHEPTREELN